MMLLHIQTLTHFICHVVFLFSYCLTCLIQCLHVHLLMLQRV